jgi:oligopeptide transport system substrate-binding protein
MAWTGRSPTKLALGLVLLAILLLLAARGASAVKLERAEVVFSNGAEVASLDPQAVSGIPEGRVLVALYEGLTTRDPTTLEPRPGVAESWEIAPDGLGVVFRLREGARWSNGDALVAADFEWSWRRLLAPETAAPYAGLLANVAGFSARDERTFEVVFRSPIPYFLHLTSFHPLFPVHRGTIEAARERFPETWNVAWMRPGMLVTNGAYVLTGRRINDRVRLAKNPRYWDADAVHVRTIDVLALDHLGTLLNLYLTGEVDWIERVPPHAAPRLRGRPDFHVTPALGTYFYRVNTTRPPLDDPRVRRALALAIDRRAICESITRRGERPAWSFSPPGLAGYAPPELEHAPRSADAADDARAFAADCARARELLHVAGHGKTGERLRRIELHYNTSELHRDVAEVVADGWRAHLGLDVAFTNEESKVYIETQRALGYDVSRSSWFADYPDASSFLEVFLSGGENNRTGWSNARYDELVRGAASERDADARFAALEEAERILLEELPILPVYGYVTQNLVNPRLTGFHENALDEHCPKTWRLSPGPTEASER